MNEEKRFDPSRHGLDDAAKRLKEISEKDYTSRIAKALGEHEEETNELAPEGTIECTPTFTFGNGSPEVVHMPQQTNIPPVSGTLPHYSVNVHLSENPTALNPAGLAYGGLPYCLPAMPLAQPVYRLSTQPELTEERLRTIVAETIQRVLYPETDSTVTHQHRRVRAWDEDGTEWRGVLYRVEKESEL